MNAYVGNELELFADAKNWKQYWKRRIQPYVRGDVLDIGAGAGATRANFRDHEFNTWHAVEPDENYARKISFPKTKVINGTLQDINDNFDTILYIDVLEHIQTDHIEVAEALGHLNPGGNLVVLSPAHNFLYSPFDKAIGHYRRYNRTMLDALTPEGAVLSHAEYIDSAGMILSLANRWLLRSPSPSRAQIQTWDKIIVPISQLVDPLVARRLGKSIIAIWKKLR